MGRTYIILALIATASLNVKAQVFTGNGVASTYIQWRSNLGEVQDDGFSTFFAGGLSSVQATLTPGIITFNALNYSPGNPIVISDALIRTDPFTFETRTYNYEITISPYSYSASTGPSAIIANSGGGLQYTADWQEDPLQLFGSYVIDGPSQDVAGSFDLFVQPHAQLGFNQPLDVANYPSQIAVGVFGSNPYAMTELFEVTIDSLVFDFTVMEFSPLLFPSGGAPHHYDLSVVPEPRGWALLAGLGLLVVGIVHRQRVGVR
jgi:hypothetical protein